MVFSRSNFNDNRLATGAMLAQSGHMPGKGVLNTTKRVWRFPAFSKSILEYHLKAPFPNIIDCSNQRYDIKKCRVRNDPAIF